MFTGIVREVGIVRSVESGGEGVRIAVEAPHTAESAALGDSVAVAGVCLTVTANGGGALSFDAVPETLRRTSLAGQPLGGHVVQGHVDGVGTVRSLEPEGEGARLTVEVPAELRRYCVEKGSIAVEGVSLTVAALGEETVEIALVPHTLAETTLGELTPGDPVNLEVDVLAKYVERLLAHHEPPGDEG